MLACMTLVNMQTVLMHLRSYMKILLTDEARRVKYILRILKLHFYFYILHKFLEKRV